MAGRAKRFNERTIQNDIVRYLQAQGWVVLQTFNGSSRGGSVWMTKGMPDLVAIRNGWVVFFEVKSPTGRLTPAQRELHEALRHAGGFVYVVRSVEECARALDTLGAV